MAAKPIVAATDGSQESLRAVEWAASEAALRGAPLRIVSAAALLPRMIGRQGGTAFDTVADVVREDRDRALAAAASARSRFSDSTSVTVSTWGPSWRPIIRGSSAAADTIRSGAPRRTASRAAQSTARSDSSEPSVAATIGLADMLVLHSVP